MFELYTPYLHLFKPSIGPVYLFPSPLCAHHCWKTNRNRECVQTFLIHNVAFNKTVIWECLTKKLCWQVFKFVILHEVHFGLNVNFRVTQKQLLTSNLSGNGKGHSQVSQMLQWCQGFSHCNCHQALKNYMTLIFV